MGKVNIALFGVGRIGAIHFSGLLGDPRACVRWVVEADVIRARQLVSEYHLEGEVQVVDIQEAGKVFANTSVTAVLICTPHQTHEDLILQALKAGKAVFCEKPLSLTVSSVIKCYDEAESAKLPLMCGFNRRYDPQYRAIYNKIRSRDIGEVRVVKITCREPKNNSTKQYLQVSGGIFVDAMVHDIDLCSFLVGEFPITVYAQGHATNQMIKDCNDIDSALVILKYPGGTIACLDISREADIGSYFNRAEVLGNDGLLETGIKKPFEMIHWSGGDTKGIQTAPSHQNIDHFSESFKLEIEHFIAVVTGQCELEITAKSAIIANIVAAACKSSLDSHQEINLPEYAKTHFNYSM